MISFNMKRFYRLCVGMGYNASTYQLLDNDDLSDINSIGMHLVFHECIAGAHIDVDEEVIILNTYSVIGKEKFETATYKGLDDINASVYQENTETEMIRRLIGYAEKMMHRYGKIFHNGKANNIEKTPHGLYYTHIARVESSIRRSALLENYRND